jgi:hypothetical protein
MKGRAALPLKEEKSRKKGEKEREREIRFFIEKS